MATKQNPVFRVRSGWLWGQSRLRLFVLLLLLVGLVLPIVVVAQEEPPLTHVVLPGETLYGIAARYGVSVQAIAEANDISNPNFIRSGSRLVIPLTAGQFVRVHVVRRGETLSEIAEMYGVTVEDIDLANDLISPDYVYAGQRLYIPVVESQVTETPAPTETVQPLATETPRAVTAACPSGCEVISITAPAPGATVSNPVMVTGVGSAAEQTLVVAVLDSAGFEIGSGYALINGPLGEPGVYSGTITYTVPANTQPGRIQVYSVSPRDGAIEHLTSVEVTLQGAEQGAGLDTVLQQLETALVAKDYATLKGLMTDPWLLVFYQSDQLMLDATTAMEQLQTNYLGPGNISIDPAVNARALLEERMEPPLPVQQVIFSTGWGPDQVDDAFLLLVEDDAGQTRWGGLVYVFDALRDY